MSVIADSKNRVAGPFLRTTERCAQSIPVPRRGDFAHIVHKPRHNPQMDGCAQRQGGPNRTARAMRSPLGWARTRCACECDTHQSSNEPDEVSSKRSRAGMSCYVRTSHIDDRSSDNLMVAACKPMHTVRRLRDRTRCCYQTSGLVSAICQRSKWMTTSALRSQPINTANCATPMDLSSDRHSPTKERGCEAAESNSMNAAPADY